VKLEGKYFTFCFFASNLKKSSLLYFYILLSVCMFDLSKISFHFLFLIAHMIDCAFLPLNMDKHQHAFPSLHLNKTHTQKEEEIAIFVTKSEFVCYIGSSTFSFSFYLNNWIVKPKIICFPVHHQDMAGISLELPREFSLIFKIDIQTPNCSCHFW
jgi:hypothetical protein